MSGIQMNVEDRKMEWIFIIIFVADIFFEQIPGFSLLFFWQLYFFVSSWEMTRERPPDELPECAPRGWTALVRNLSGAHVSYQKYLLELLNAVIIQLAEAY